MDEKIEKMRHGGKILGEVLEQLINFAAPGVSEIELDKLAEKLIIKKGGKPGFKEVPGYHHSICVSTNDVVVHGIPTDRKLAPGDIIGIDCGVFFEGYHTDMAETLRVNARGPAASHPRPTSSPIRFAQGSGRSSGVPRSASPLTHPEQIDSFLAAGKKALFAGIRQARAGNRVGHISQAIQNIVEGAGYSVVRSLVGHGVGKTLHEKPEIPGYLSTRVEKTPELTLGATIAVEVIYNMGKPEVEYGRDDDWTISTQDKALSGLFERTILITEEGPELLTKLSGEKI